MTKPIDLVRERRLRALDEKMRAALAGRPALAWRTVEYLATGTDDASPSGAMEVTKMAAAERRVVPVRLPEDLVRKADALVPFIDSDPTMQWGRVTRSAVLRIALAEGIAVLEERYCPEPEPAEQPAAGTLDTPPADTWLWWPGYQGGGGMRKSHRLHTDSARTLCGAYEPPAGPSAWEPAPGLPRCRNCERATAKRDGADGA